MDIQLRINIENQQTKILNIQTGSGYVVSLPQPRSDSKIVFELFNANTGLGPKNLITQREGNDLQITFENSNTPELILENYYGASTIAPVVGLSDDGNYQTYISQSSSEVSNISEESEDIQASEVSKESSVRDFSLPKWFWAMISSTLVFGGLIASRGQKDLVSSKDELFSGLSIASNSREGTVKISLPSNSTMGDIAEVNLTKEDGTLTKVMLTKQSGSNWLSSQPEIISHSSDGIVTISANVVKDGSEVTVVVKDQGGNQSSTVKTVVATEALQPVVPKLEINNLDNSIVLSLPEKALTGDQVVVAYYPKTDGDFLKKESVTLTKQDNGTWVSSNQDILENVSTGSTEAKLSANKLVDNTIVTAYSIDAAGSSTPESMRPTVQSLIMENNQEKADMSVNNTLLIKQDEDGVFISEAYRKIDLGMGDDILQLGQPGKTFSYLQTHNVNILGGEGNDELKVFGVAQAPGTQSILSWESDHLSGLNGWEKLNFNNVEGKLQINVPSVLASKNGGLVTNEFTGKESKALLITGGDNIYLNLPSKDISFDTSESKALKDGVTYKVYDTIASSGMSDIWVQEGINII